MTLVAHEFKYLLFNKDAPNQGTLLLNDYKNSIIQKGRNCFDLYYMFDKTWLSIDYQFESGYCKNEYIRLISFLSNKETDHPHYFELNIAERIKNYKLFVKMTVDWIREDFLKNKQSLLNIIEKNENKNKKSSIVNHRNIEFDESDNDAKNDEKNEKSICNYRLPHEEKKKIVLALIQEFYNNENKCEPIELALEIFDTCDPYMTMETICENVGSTIDVHLPNYRIHISQENLNFEVNIDFERLRNVKEQRKLADHVGTTLHEDVKRAVKIHKRNRKDSIVIDRLNKGARKRLVIDDS